MKEFCMRFAFMKITKTKSAVLKICNFSFILSWVLFFGLFSIVWIGKTNYILEAVSFSIFWLEDVVSAVLGLWAKINPFQKTLEQTTSRCRCRRLEICVVRLAVKRFKHKRQQIRRNWKGWNFLVFYAS